MSHSILVAGRQKALLCVSLFAISACNGPVTVDVPAFMDRMNGGSSAEGAVTTTAARPEPDSRGVITYPTYQVLVARDGDTFDQMGTRIGVSGAELAKFNGLPVTYVARGGELFALPRNVGGELVGGASAWNPAIVTTAIDRSGTGAPTSGGNTTGGIPLGTVVPGGVEPLRHQAQAGETAYTIARQYNVSVTALASWNGLGPDLAIRPGQMLLIPAAAPVSSVAPVAPPAVTTEAVISSPELAEVPTETETASATTTTTTTNVNPPPATTRLSAPVSGSIVLPYSPNDGPSKNEGVDFGSSAGAPVKAAADGTVALISEARGGLGTIVLIQHADGILTVYGRITGVTVSKGQKVSRGQTIGVVADNDPATLHFEVRKGVQSADPTDYL